MDSQPKASIPSITYRRLPHPRSRGHAVTWDANGEEVHHNLPDIEYAWEIDDLELYSCVYRVSTREMRVTLKNETDLAEVPVFKLGHVVKIRETEAVRHMWSDIKVRIPSGESVLMTSRWLSTSTQSYSTQEGTIVL
jgi:hypothetical protein